VPPVPCTLGYIAKVDSAGRLAYLTYLPGAPETFTVDPAGNVYFAGAAAAGELAATPGAYRASPEGARAAFVAKLNPAGAALLYATYYGRPEDAAVASLAVDSAGNAWFLSPQTEGVTTTWIDRRVQARLTKLNATGSAVLYETPFIGGTLAVDSQDRLAVLTRSYIDQVVRTPKGLVNSACGEMALTLLDRDGTVLLNRPGDFGYLAALTADARLVFGASSNGPAFAVQTVEPANGPEAACLLNAASLSAPNRLAPGEIFTIVGVGIGPRIPVSFRLDPRGMVPSSLDGLRVLLDGAPIPVLYADDGQINAIAPFTLPGTSFSVEVEFQGRRTPALRIAAAETHPGFFTLDGSGGGPALVFNEDGTLNNPANPAKLGSIVTLFATGTGATNPQSIEGAVARSTDARPFWPASIILGGVVGGIPTEILYSGPSPGSLTSVTQINLRLPGSVPPGVGWQLTAWPIVFTGPLTQLATIALKN
jgi:uncharacterized protein (TIGR03437 family)